MPGGDPALPSRNSNSSNRISLKKKIGDVVTNENSLSNPSMSQHDMTTKMNNSSLADMSKALFDRPLKILSLSKKDDARQAKREHAMNISIALHQYHMAKRFEF